MTGFLTRLNHSAAAAPMSCPMTVAMAAPRMPVAGQPSSEDHHGVENHVDHCADDEGDHRQHRVTHSLQEPLPVGLQKDAPAEHEVHREVFPAQLLQFGIVGQGGSDPVRE